MTALEADAILSHILNTGDIVHQTRSTAYLLIEAPAWLLNQLMLHDGDDTLEDDGTAEEEPDMEAEPDNEDDDPAEDSDVDEENGDDEYDYSLPGWRPPWEDKEDQSVPKNWPMTRMR